MSSIFHPTNQNRHFGMKLEWLSLPTIWPFKGTKLEKDDAALQIYTEDQPLPPSQRLIVILPDGNGDILFLPKRIWELASPDRRQVLLMIRPCREENEFHARWNLTTLAAIIRDPRVVVQTQLVLGQSLEQAASQCAQPEDVFVCFEEHQVRGFLTKRRLSEILAKKTHQPVYTLKGTASEIVDPISARLIDFLFLALCLVSMIAFFAIEVWIDQNSAGTPQSILQILAVIAEVWVISTIASRSFQI